MVHSHIALLLPHPWKICSAHGHKKLFLAVFSYIATARKPSCSCCLQSLAASAVIKLFRIFNNTGLAHCDRLWCCVARHMLEQQHEMSRLKNVQVARFGRPIVTAIHIRHISFQLYHAISYFRSTMLSKNQTAPK